MDVDFFGYVHCISIFLPAVRGSKYPAAVALIGSEQGITNPPGNQPTMRRNSSSKMAEQLCYDFRDTSTAMHLVVPCWVSTGSSSGELSSEKGKPSGAWSVDGMQVAEILKEKMGEGEF